MLVSVNGINPAFKDKLIALVEGFDFANFTYTQVKGQMPTSCVFECDNDDENFIIPQVKGSIKKSELGNIMMFNVAPFGQAMWMPKR